MKFARMPREQWTARVRERVSNCSFAALITDFNAHLGEKFSFTVNDNGALGSRDSHSRCEPRAHLSGGGKFRFNAPRATTEPSSYAKAISI